MLQERHSYSWCQRDVDIYSCKMFMLWTRSETNEIRAKLQLKDHILLFVAPTSKDRIESY